MITLPLVVIRQLNFTYFLINIKFQIFIINCLSMYKGSWKRMFACEGEKEKYEWHETTVDDTKYDLN